MSLHSSAGDTLINFSRSFLIGNLLGKEGDFLLELTGKLFFLFAELFAICPLLNAFLEMNKED